MAKASRGTTRVGTAFVSTQDLFKARVNGDLVVKVRVARGPSRLRVARDLTLRFAKEASAIWVTMSVRLRWDAGTVDEATHEAIAFVEKGVEIRFSGLVSGGVGRAG